MKRISTEKKNRKKTEKTGEKKKSLDVNVEMAVERTEDRGGRAQMDKFEGEEGPL